MAKRKRVRERATSLEAMESKRKLRLIFLAFAAMSSYMQVRELLRYEYPSVHVCDDLSAPPRTNERATRPHVDVV